MYSKIVAIDFYLPDKVLDNNQLAVEFPEWDALKISEKIGINERHLVNENETAFDIALKASEKIFNNFDKKDIDFLLFCTQSPDYFLPTTACIIQDKLGLNTNIGAIDFNLGCSGYIYGLAIAKGLISSNISRNVLLLTSETYSKHIHPKDKGNRSIFGDAAAATIISACNDEQILEFELGTDGKGMENLIVYNGGLRNKFNPNQEDQFDESGNIINPNNLYMNGAEILKMFWVTDRLTGMNFYPLFPN
jgi:3-oxoacyl-[acyl-carrier-protein] synthase III